MRNKIPIVVVCGPTASGKTALAVKIAREYRGEVVSADSMQVYKTMNIGTAKPGKSEMGGVPHHLIDFLEPDERFSVADYVIRAEHAVKDIHVRGKLPILAGGTGLYISSLIDGVRFEGIGSGENAVLRKELETLAKDKGNMYVWELLKQCDPVLASKLHPNNISRIIRGIEVYRATGVPMSRQQEKARECLPPYCPLMIGLCFKDRQKLYDRINARVGQMIVQGLLDEARSFMERYSKTAAQAIGYKELEPYFEGTIPLAEAGERIKMATRRYAKRQLTWFKRDTRIHWLNVDEYTDEGLAEAVFGLVENYL